MTEFKRGDIVAYRSERRGVVCIGRIESAYIRNYVTVRTLSGQDFLNKRLIKNRVKRDVSIHIDKLVKIHKRVYRDATLPDI